MTINKQIILLYVAVVAMAYPTFIGADHMLEEHYLDKNGTSKVELAATDYMQVAVESTRAGR